MLGCLCKILSLVFKICKPYYIIKTPISLYKVGLLLVKRIRIVGGNRIRAFTYLIMVTVPRYLCGWSKMSFITTR